MVNHAMKNEMAKITIVSNLAGTVNHVTKNKMVSSQHVDALVRWKREERLGRRREQYHARRNSDYTM